MDFYHQNTLISGGSSGIGLALAKRLTQQGAHVVILARNFARLEKALTELEQFRQNSDQYLEAFSGDVADVTQVQAVIDQLASQEHLPQMLIHGAGDAEPGYHHQLEVPDYRRMVESHYLGAVHLTQAVLPNMRREKNGHLIYISSVLGRIGVLGYSAYGPAKAAMNTYADAIRMEVKGQGIQVSIAYPSDTDTPQLAYETSKLPGEIKYLKKIFTSHINSADDVARNILDGIQRKQQVILTDFDGRLMNMILRLLGQRGSTALLERLLAFGNHRDGRST